MKTKQKVIAFVLGAMIAVSLLGCGNFVATADGGGLKYELNIKLVPTEALKKAHPEARVLDYPASKVEGHDDFASMEECETHFNEADILGIKITMYRTSGLKEGEDYTIEHVCETAGSKA